MSHFSIFRTPLGSAYLVLARGSAWTARRNRLYRSANWTAGRLSGLAWARLAWARLERALEDLISNEEGMRFQGLAFVLAKKKWPDLIACERKKDLGLDAYACASLAQDKIGRGLACSITATLGKIQDDGGDVQKNFGDVKVLIFATGNCCIRKPKI